DRLIPYDPRAEHRGWQGRERLARELRTERFDLAILFQNAFDAAWLAWRAGIPQRVGYARDGRSLLLTQAIPVPRPEEIPAHEQFYYLELLRRAGWIGKPGGEEFISLEVSEEQRRRASVFLLEAGARPHAPRLAIGAGASYGSAKCWPPERFSALANRLTANFDSDVILFGTSAEQPVAEAIIAGMKRAPINLTGRTAIADLPGLLSQCHLFVGNDSGAMHVAAAVGLPVVAVFGPTDPQGTAPVTPRCSIVQEKPYCSPCFLRRCPTDHRCMTAIQPETVADAAQSWLAARQAPHA
ncbi:MAG: lipopolysaccharide heptosyltransferase II, partial [Acidobacteriia bacterium]|nr:lipopolysaccharide heptosyltransferase II [Terriglobia bacterium]